jgi:hypothetical protein
MADLSPEARALVEAGRSALRPAAADRERILAALRARTAGDGGGNGGAGTAGGGFGWPALAVTLVGVGIVIGGILYGLRGGETHVSVAPATSANDSAPAVTTAAVAQELAPVAASAVPAVAALGSADATGPEAPRAPARHTGDHLAEEVALMSRAETELHAGRFTNALQLLDEHRREFPQGTLAQERLAARIQALCGLGRVKEADAALARLTRSSPQSLHEDSARAACATNAKP